MPEPIHSLERGEVSDLLAGMGEPAFRALQVWKWLYAQRVADWARMSNLPAALRSALAARFTVAPALREDSRTAADGTTKILARLPDGEAVETVLIPARDRRTACVSSQAGCRFRCAFCASGQAGFRRNLEAGEIVGQVLLAMSEPGPPVTHVVFMGIGEPLDNCDAVLKSLRILNDEQGLAIGARRLTVSTCGVIPGIRRLAEQGMQVELSVSLHAPDSALRARLMPVERRYPLADLLNACREYTAATRRIITFEYTLIGGVNDRPAHADGLIALLKPLPCRVNLIPLSPVEEFDGRPSEPAAVRAFAAALAAAGINATVRDSRGASLKAACGQLRYCPAADRARREGVPPPAGNP